MRLSARGRWSRDRSATCGRPVNRIATRALYFMFTCSSTAANASIGAAFDSSPASTARRSGIFDTMSMVAAVADGWSEHTSTSDSTGWPMSPSSLAGTWCMVAATSDSRHGGLHRRCDRAPGRDQRLELVADLGQRVRHRDDDLALELASTHSDAVTPAASHGVAMNTTSDDGGVVVVTGLDGEASVGPPFEQSVTDLHRPVLRPRPEDHVEAHRGQPHREAASGRTCCTQHADLHPDTVVSPDEGAQTPDRPDRTRRRSGRAARW